MIYLFTGENDFMLHHTMRRMRDEFIQEHTEQSLEVKEAQALSVSDLPQLYSGASLFSPKRLVIVSSPSTNKAVWEVLPEHLPQDDDVDVILIDSKPDKRTRTYKWLQKNAELKNFSMLDERDTSDWVATTARSLGINISPEIIRFLLTYVGTDQWRLSQELKKLSLANKSITQDLIRDIIEPNPQATAFELLDAVIAGRREDAMKLIAIVRQVEDPYKFVGLLTSQVYALAVCHAAGDRPSTTIAKDAGLHPYVASKTQTIARRLSKERLSSIIKTIADLDDRLKSTGGDPWLLVESALSRITLRQ